MKQIEVTILGQSYLLGCPEGGEVRLMRSRRPGRPRDERHPRRRQGKARERIAVLAALNLAYAALADRARRRCRRRSARAG